MNMTWSSAEIFRSLLEKVGDTVSKGTIEKLTSLAVKDMPYAYKDVSMLLEKQMKRKGGQSKARLNVLYVLSSICRDSKNKHGAKDKYGGRLAKRMETIAGLLSELPTSYWPAVGKVVDAWRKEAIFPEDALAHLRGFVGSNSAAVPREAVPPAPAVTVEVWPTAPVQPPPQEVALPQVYISDVPRTPPDLPAPEPEASAPSSVAQGGLPAMDYDFGDEFHDPPVEEAPPAALPPPPASLPLPPPPAGRPPGREEAGRKRKSRWDTMSEGPGGGGAEAAPPREQPAESSEPQGPPSKSARSSRWGPGPSQASGPPSPKPSLPLPGPPPPGPTPPSGLPGPPPQPSRFDPSPPSERRRHTSGFSDQPREGRDQAPSEPTPPKPQQPSRALPAAVLEAVRLAQQQAQQQAKSMANGGDSAAAPPPPLPDQPYLGEQDAPVPPPPQEDPAPPPPAPPQWQPDPSAHHQPPPSQAPPPVAYPNPYQHQPYQPAPGAGYPTTMSQPPPPNMMAGPPPPYAPQPMPPQWRGPPQGMGMNGLQHHGAFGMQGQYPPQQPHWQQPPGMQMRPPPGPHQSGPYRPRPPPGAPPSGFRPPTLRPPPRSLPPPVNSGSAPPPTSQSQKDSGGGGDDMEVDTAEQLMQSLSEAAMEVFRGPGQAWAKPQNAPPPNSKEGKFDSKEEQPKAAAVPPPPPPSAPLPQPPASTSLPSTEAGPAAEPQALVSAHETVPAASTATAELSSAAVAKGPPAEFEGPNAANFTPAHASSVDPVVPTATAGTSDVAVAQPGGGVEEEQPASIASNTDPSRGATAPAAGTVEGLGAAGLAAGGHIGKTPATEESSGGAAGATPPAVVGVLEGTTERGPGATHEGKTAESAANGGRMGEGSAIAGATSAAGPAPEVPADGNGAVTQGDAKSPAGGPTQSKANPTGSPDWSTLDLDF